MYKAEYEKAILDPAVRMKMIIGMPKDSAITWARKCHYDINTQAVAKWRPLESSRPSLRATDPFVEAAKRVQTKTTGY